MANTKSAAKRAKKALVRRERNRANKSALKTALKRFYQDIQSLSDVNALNKALSVVQSKIAVARRKGIIHRNKMANLISQCAHAVAGKVSA